MFRSLIMPAVSLMNRLSFKMKILLSVSILFALLIMPSRATFLNYIRQIETTDAQLTGLTYITRIHRLIQDIQLHRGLSNAYANGNRNYKNEILAAERSIKSAFTDLVAFDRNRLDLLKSDGSFVDAISRFALVTLSRQSASGSAEALFALHSRIIDDLIETIRHIAKQSGFAAGNSLQINYIAGLLQEKLLLLQEKSGQLRGMAVGLFSRGSISDKAREEILSRYTLIKALENNLLDNKILDKTKHFLTIEEQTTLATYRLDRMLGIVYAQLILSERPRIESTRFFKIATEAIDAEASLYRTLARSYRMLIEKKRSSVTSGLLWALLGFVAILVGALYLLGAFYHSIAASLKKLQHASEMIASGKTDIRLQADTRDEIGNAILSFNHMSRKLGKTLSFLDGYKMAIDVSSIVSKTNPKGVITYVNRKFCEISGYSREELIGMPHNIVRHPDMPKERFRELWETITDKKVWKGVITNRRKDGGSYIVDATIIPVLDSSGEIVEYVGIRHDITELERSKEEIRKQKIDMATGLYTQNQLIEELHRAAKPVLFYLNINDFSSINDFYGIRIADRLLIYVADLLREMFPAHHEHIYKYHNDEFFLLFDADTVDPAACERYMQRILDHIEQQSIDCDGQSCISITLRGGIAHYLQSAQHEALLSLAMVAAREAKKQHKKFLLYKRDMNREGDYKHNIEWIAKIREAIRDDRIVPYFQPIIDNRNGTVTKYEALVRLIDREGKAISPYFFLEIAKKAKLYTRITKIMLEKTAAMLRRFPQFDYSVNLTVEDIQDEEIRAYIMQVVKKCEHPNHLIFEITESESIDDYTTVYRFTREVSACGIRIAIDDFGSGYANFDHIVNLKPDFIKIDGSLIKEIDSSSEAAIVTEAIIAFSKKMGSQTVVEYVHNEAVYRKVIALGADFSQGFHLGEPAAEIRTLRQCTAPETQKA